MDNITSVLSQIKDKEHGHASELSKVLGSQIAALEHVKSFANGQKNHTLDENPIFPEFEHELLQIEDQVNQWSTKNTTKRKAVLPSYNERFTKAFLKLRDYMRDIQKYDEREELQVGDRVRVIKCFHQGNGGYRCIHCQVRVRRCEHCGRYVGPGEPNSCPHDQTGQHAEGIIGYGKSSAYGLICRVTSWKQDIKRWMVRTEMKPLVIFPRSREGTGGFAVAPNPVKAYHRHQLELLKPQFNTGENVIIKKQNAQGDKSRQFGDKAKVTDANFAYTTAGGVSRMIKVEMFDSRAEKSYMVSDLHLALNEEREFAEAPAEEGEFRPLGRFRNVASELITVKRAAGKWQDRVKAQKAKKKVLQTQVEAHRIRDEIIECQRWCGSWGSDKLNKKVLHDFKPFMSGTPLTPRSLAHHISAEFGGIEAYGRETSYMDENGERWAWLDGKWELDCFDNNHRLNGGWYYKENFPKMEKRRSKNDELSKVVKRYMDRRQGVNCVRCRIWTRSREPIGLNSRSVGRGSFAGSGFICPHCYKNFPNPNSLEKHVPKCPDLGKTGQQILGNFSSR